MPTTRKETTEADYVRCAACEKEFDEAPIFYPRKSLRVVKGSNLPWGEQKQDGTTCPRGHRIEDAT